ncbi:MAG TPA: hypothetical protein VH720_06190 [Candidatus Limnocylindrales bacterium]|jgi:hypothetical protein
MNLFARLAALVAVLALVLAACGGAASPSASPSVDAGPSSSASATQASEPVPSGEPSPSSFALPEIDLGAAAAALENIDSYQLSMKVEGTSTTEIAGTVIRDPEPAHDLTITTGGVSQHVILVGGTAYVGEGDGPFVQLPAAAVEAMTRQFDIALLIGGFNRPDLAGAMETVGNESKNGVDTTHYHLDGSTPAGQAAGVPSTGVLDLWIAGDGYMVSMVATDMAPQAKLIQFDISNVNDPANTVEAPS